MLDYSVGNKDQNALMNMDEHTIIMKNVFITEG